MVRFFGATMLDSFDEDATGRFTDDCSTRLLQGVTVSRAAELRWTADLVKKRAEGAERLSSRVGPRTRASKKRSRGLCPGRIEQAP